MKRIQDLIADLPSVRTAGDTQTEIERLVYDSRRIAPGDCFFAVSGTQCDGHDFIEAAVAAGARAV
ncbi:MAG: UDP-N-acetylmuramoyl-L-alanyl-D-glutamate--2,6-diaminopimelate ligase, partial [Alistipes sp.]|nr:UDP-N-acetylmuramoyl-L-alanyl-D-glutamate--2,6-diaminopimelate ligase [Alistipes sp.]